VELGLPNGIELSCQLSTSSAQNVFRRPARSHGQSQILVIFQGSSEVLGGPLNHAWGMRTPPMRAIARTFMIWTQADLAHSTCRGSPRL
jgi:hypothetical protein